MVMIGESGSGKTETCKYAIEYFTNTSCKNEILKTKINQVLFSSIDFWLIKRFSFKKNNLLIYFYSILK
jgi:ABC-type oligopeptide transport system ATPase subunit